MTHFNELRNRMVDHQLISRGIHDTRVLDAMRRVEREKFVPQDEAELAYRDSPLPIEAGQTISQPYIVALMSEALELNAGDKVLEIGTGSGYAAAVLAEITDQVFTIERHKILADLAEKRLEKLGYKSVQVRHGDGTLGWPEQAPFNAIVATAGGPEVPETLKQQLAIGGRLVIPVGHSVYSQKLLRVRRLGENEFAEEDLGGVRFVPLVGAQGWLDESAKTPSTAH